MLYNRFSSVIESKLQSVRAYVGHPVVQVSITGIDMVQGYRVQWVIYQQSYVAKYQKNFKFTVFTVGRPGFFKIYVKFPYGLFWLLNQITILSCFLCRVQFPLTEVVFSSPC